MGAFATESCEELLLTRLFVFPSACNNSIVLEKNIYIFIYWCFILESFAKTRCHIPITFRID